MSADRAFRAYSYGLTEYGSDDDTEPVRPSRLPSRPGERRCDGGYWHTGPEFLCPHCDTAAWMRGNRTVRDCSGYRGKNLPSGAMFLRIARALDYGRDYRECGDKRAITSAISHARKRGYLTHEHPPELTEAGRARVTELLTDARVVAAAGVSIERDDD